MKLVIIFIILVVVLFTGIFVLMKPYIFDSLLSPYGNTPENESLLGHVISKEIIILGSTLTVVGLVGLSILGIITIRLSKEEETME